MSDRPNPQDDKPIANGWTQNEAVAMEKHISARVGDAWVRSEPSNADYKRAERMSDPTDRIHDVGRERAADNYKPTQAARDAARSHVRAVQNSPAVQNQQRVQAATAQSPELAR